MSDTKTVGENPGWVQRAHNMTLDGDGYFISYNPDMSRLGGSWAGEGADETALCINDKYYILVGDFRTEYETAFRDGPDACLAVYQRHKAEHRDMWSEDAP